MWLPIRLRHFNLLTEYQKSNTTIWIGDGLQPEWSYVKLCALCLALANCCKLTELHESIQSLFNLKVGRLIHEQVIALDEVEDQKVQNQQSGPSPTKNARARTGTPPGTPPNTPDGTPPVCAAVSCPGA